MSELSAALRQFADRIDRGEALVDATQCAMVLGNDAGLVQGTYIGKFVPSNRAGIHLLAAGIQRFNADQLAPLPSSQMPPNYFATSGSTH